VIDAGRPTVTDQFLVLMKGFPASGKSTLARALAQRQGWSLIDKDDIKDFTAGMPDGNRLAYRILWQVVRRQLQVGLSVIADTPLSYPEGYATGQDLAAEAGASLMVVEMRLTGTEWRRRLEARQPSASTHKIAGWAAMQSLLAAYNDVWRYPIAPDHHVVVDGALPVDLLCEQVLARIDQPIAV
jgi:predicted kinase